MSVVNVSQIDYNRSAFKACSSSIWAKYGQAEADWNIIMSQTEGPGRNGDKQNYSRWLGLGIEFVGVLSIFCYIGYKLDESFNSGPWLMLTGFFVGFAGMLYLILKETGIVRRK